MVAFLYDGRSWTFPLPLADAVADTRLFRIGYVVYAWLTLVIQTNKDLSKIMHLSIDVLFQFSNSMHQLRYPLARSSIPWLDTLIGTGH